MDEAVKDRLLSAMYVQPHRERNFYERNADAIGEFEKRCLVSVSRDELGEIVGAEVTDIGKWFLLRGGFRQESIESRRIEQGQAREEAMKSIAKSSNRIAVWAMVAAFVSALADICQLVLPHIFHAGFIEIYDYRMKAILR